MDVHRDADDDPVEFVLQTGYRIAATAVDEETNEPIRTDLYAVMSGDNWSGAREWTLAKSGTLALERPRTRRNVFSATTNEEGIAVISNLHGKASVGLNVRHHDFEQHAANSRRSTDVTLHPGKLASITIRMQPKGTQVLGR